MAEITTPTQEAPQPPPTESSKDDPARSVGAIIGYVAAGVVVAGGALYLFGHKKGVESADSSQSLVGNLVF